MLTNAEYEMRTLGNTVACTAIKLYNTQRHKMRIPLKQYVTEYCREDKAAKFARRVKPFLGSEFWKGVDDALQSRLVIANGQHVAKICHRCGGVRYCEHLTDNFTEADNSSI